MSDGVVISGVALIPLIIGTIQLLKRLFPQASGNVWLVLSVILGIAGQTAALVAESGLPSNFEGWLSLVILGWAFGLAASKAYDEVLNK